MIKKLDFIDCGGWMERFAKESAQMGRAMAELNGADAKKSPQAMEAWAEHALRMKERLSPLSRLHTIIVGQAAAEAWAQTIELSDFESKIDSCSGGALGRGLIASMSEMANELGIDAAIACVVCLRQELSSKFSEMQPQMIAKAVARFAVASAPFGQATALNDALLGSEEKSSIRKTANERYWTFGNPSVAKASASSRNSILSWMGGSSMSSLLFDDARRRMWTDEGGAPEGRLFLLRKAQAFDNPILLEAFPWGVHDGVSLLLPLPAVAAALGQEGAIEQAMAVLRRAARGVLGLEKAGEGLPETIAPGSMKDELLSRGMLQGASKLCRGSMETLLRESGEDMASISAAMQSACFGSRGELGGSLPKEAGESLNAALRSAAWHGASEEAKKCLKDGADPRLASARGLTPLMMAAAAGSERLVALLIPLSNLSALDARGMSALHHAAGAGSMECCALLGPLMSGAVKNCDRETPEDVARAAGQEDLGDWLGMCGAVVQERMALAEDRDIVGAGEGSIHAKRPRL